MSSSSRRHRRRRPLRLTPHIIPDLHTHPPTRLRPRLIIPAPTSRRQPLTLTLTIAPPTLILLFPPAA